MFGAQVVAARFPLCRESRLVSPRASPPSPLLFPSPPVLQAVRHRHEPTDDATAARPVRQPLTPWDFCLCRCRGPARPAQDDPRYAPARSRTPTCVLRRCACSACAAASAVRVCTSVSGSRASCAISVRRALSASTDWSISLSSASSATGLIAPPNLILAPLYDRSRFYLVLASAEVCWRTIRWCGPCSILRRWPPVFGEERRFRGRSDAQSIEVAHLSGWRAGDLRGHFGRGTDNDVCAQTSIGRARSYGRWPRPRPPAPKRWSEP